MAMNATRLVRSRLTRIAVLALFPILNQFFVCVFLLDPSLEQHAHHFLSRWNFYEKKVPWLQRPRTMYVEGMPIRYATAKHRTIDSEESKKQIQYAIPTALCGNEEEDCFVPGRWQETNNMTCNYLHEVDLLNANDLNIIGKGGKRLVLSKEDVNGTAIALKLFKFRADRDDDFGPMTIELQRRDALVHEQLSSSPYIADLYGYCGTSAIYAFGDGGQLGENIQRDGPIRKAEVLQVAHQIAASVADLHHPDDETGQPTIIHSDIHGEQWIKVNGKYQLTDFNLAKLVKRSKTTNKNMPIRRDVVDNWFSPEVHLQQYHAESIGTEKMDVWNMGNILYLMLVGTPPFDGLGRQEGHALIKEHKRPEIPSQLRNSKGFVVQTMIFVIDWCLQEDQAKRPSAREVADYLRTSIKVPFDYRREAFNRPRRFPSVEERIKRYMSNWYVPPCDSTATIQYQMLHSDKDQRPRVLVRELATNYKRTHIVEIDSEVQQDTIMMVNPTILSNDKKVPHAGYQADVIQTALPLLDSLQDKPLLMQWGDRVSLHLDEAEPYDSTLAIPHMKKCRPIISKVELERMTAATCYRANDRPQSNTVYRPGATHEPILWKLDSHRLMGPIADAIVADKPWSEKQAKAVFRGKLTGHAMDAKRNKLFAKGPMNNEEYCNAIERCRFVLAHHDSSLIDARLTDLLGKPLDPNMIGVDLLGEKMELYELLDYKVIIILEGNDVASGLRWALRSESVVMMPPPTFSSWVMEELLEPWVHYIPLIDPNFNDVEEKMQWVLANDAEAQRIAHRGSLWIKDLLEHPDSERDSMEINKQILERYQKLLEPSDQLESMIDDSSDQFF